MCHRRCQALSFSFRHWPRRYILSHSSLEIPHTSLGTCPPLGSLTVFSDPGTCQDLQLAYWGLSLNYFIKETMNSEKKTSVFSINYGAQCWGSYKTKQQKRKKLIDFGIRDREMVQRLEAHTVLQRTWVWFPSPTSFPVRNKSSQWENTCHT